MQATEANWTNHLPLVYPPANPEKLTPAEEEYYTNRLSGIGHAIVTIADYIDANPEHTDILTAIIRELEEDRRFIIQTRWTYRRETFKP